MNNPSKRPGAVGPDVLHQVTTDNSIQELWEEKLTAEAKRRKQQQTKLLRTGELDGRRDNFGAGFLSNHVAHDAVVFVTWDPCVAARWSHVGLALRNGTASSLIV